MLEMPAAWRIYIVGDLSGGEFINFEFQCFCYAFLIGLRDIVGKDLLTVWE